MLQHLNMMADNDGDDDSDFGLKLETRPKTKRPPLYKVMILNDDYTPMEFVVHVLEIFFGLNHAQSVEIMLTVHQNIPCNARWRKSKGASPTRSS